MRIEMIDLIRFGHFCGQKVEFPARQPDYYLIYGDNEAGKSTLLRGISALLFGVPVKTPDIHSCKGSELRIGATISDETASRRALFKNDTPGLFTELNGEGPSEKRFSFRRRKGTSGTLLNQFEGQIPDDSLAPFLRELDQERFALFFGLTHDRLRAGGEELLRGQGDVGSALFQAAGLLDLRHLRDKLDADAKDLFSPKSRTRMIGKMIEDYKQARSEVRKLAISAATVKERQSELDSAKRTLEKLKLESHSLQKDLERLRRIKGNKPDLARLHDLRTALAGLESVPSLPPDARRQFQEAAAMLANADTQIGTLAEDIAEREQRIHELPANSLLKAHKNEIEELNAATTSYNRSVTDKAKRLRARDKAMELALSAWNEIWTQPVSEAEKLKNVYAAKEEILRLVADHKGITADLATAEEELRNVTQEQQQLEEQLLQHPEVSDPAGLVAAIEYGKSLGDSDAGAARLKSEVERLSRNAQREMAKLALWTGSIQDLENMRVPLAATVEQYAREWESLAAQRRNLALRHANLLEAVRHKQGELGGLAAQIAGAGETELAEARARRDELWQSIRSGTRKRADSPNSSAGDFETQLRRADEIADIRFANARDVAIHDRLVKEVATAQAEQQRLEQDMDRLENDGRKLDAEWSREWNALGRAPLSPAEMKEWMQERQSVLEQCAQSNAKEHELESLRLSAAAAAAQIREKWLALSVDSFPPHTGTDSLPVLLRMAESFARQRENERRMRDDIRRQLKSLSLEKRRQRLEECRRRLEEWVRKWDPYVSALQLPESGTPDQVAKALSVLERVFNQLDEARGMQYRVKAMGDDIEAFEKRVAQVVSALGSSFSLPELPADMVHDVAVKHLRSQLLELANAETQRETLQEQNEKDRASIAAQRRKAQQAAAALERLKALANCPNGGEQQLDAAIAASESKSNLQQELKRISAGLIDRNAIADLEQIEQEASAYDLDSLRSEIDAKAARFEAAVEEISQAASKHGELTSEFERLETSEESALQAQKAEEALAQLRPAVAQYLRLRLASEVLQKAMESYREKHQGPVLRRASELFARLTLGRHSGLTSDFGEDDKPVLVAIRQNGERVHVEGLSDGTRDQLYLALRLAAIEDHVRRVTPCPVILDDILINSDDERASAALEVIGELAEYTQVLFFTHHRRLADLGASAGAEMIELASLAASAVA